MTRSGDHVGVLFFHGEPEIFAQGVIGPSAVAPTVVGNVVRHKEDIAPEDDGSCSRGSGRTSWIVLGARSEARLEERCLCDRGGHCGRKVRAMSMAAYICSWAVYFHHLRIVEVCSNGGAPTSSSEPVRVAPEASVGALQILPK